MPNSQHACPGNQVLNSKHGACILPQVLGQESTMLLPDVNAGPRTKRAAGEEAGPVVIARPAPAPAVALGDSIALKLLKAAPRGNCVREHHGLATLKQIQFAEQVSGWNLHASHNQVWHCGACRFGVPKLASHEPHRLARTLQGDSPPFQKGAAAYSGPTAIGSPFQPAALTSNCLHAANVCCGAPHQVWVWWCRSRLPRLAWC
jgi:hypothetical protein